MPPPPPSGRSYSFLLYRPAIWPGMLNQYAQSTSPAPANAPAPETLANRVDYLATAASALNPKLATLRQRLFGDEIDKNGESGPRPEIPLLCGINIASAAVNSAHDQLAAILNRL